MGDKILVVLAHALREQIGTHLASLDAEIYFADTLGELTALVRDEGVFQVAILPADLSDAKVNFWELQGELSLLTIKPELLICARATSFRLWSSVLDLGGHDVLTAPFSPNELQRVVLQAIESFNRRTG